MKQFLSNAKILEHNNALHYFLINFETLLEVSAASGVDADIDNYRTAFHVFNHGFSNNNWAAFYTSHRSMATSQRLNAFSNDLDCMWR
jgi:hypothetical protein